MVAATLRCVWSLSASCRPLIVSTISISGTESRAADASATGETVSADPVERESAQRRRRGQRRRDGMPPPRARCRASAESSTPRWRGQAVRSASCGWAEETSTGVPAMIAASTGVLCASTRRTEAAPVSEPTRTRGPSGTDSASEIQDAAASAFCLEDRDGVSVGAQTPTEALVHGGALATAGDDGDRAAHAGGRPDGSGERSLLMPTISGPVRSRRHRCVELLRSVSSDIDDSRGGRHRPPTFAFMTPRHRLAPLAALAVAALALTACSAAEETTERATATVRSRGGGACRPAGTR